MPKNLYFSKLLDFYDFVLKDRQKEIMELYYNNDFSLAEIASNIGISKQGVRDVIKRAENLLLEADKNLKIIDKSEKYNTNLKEIINCCELAKKAVLTKDMEDIKKNICFIKVLAEDLL